MDGGFPIDLILFGMIAAFLVLRLRSILGRRQGFERPNLRAAAAARLMTGRVVDAVAEPVVVGRTLPEASSPAGQAFARMQMVDRGFSAQRFLDGAEAAFRMIVSAFAVGDRVTLRPLLSDEMYGAFESAIAAREAAGETQRTEIRSVQSATIIQATLTGRVGDITVRFVSDQVNLTAARDGTPVAGTDAVTEISDDWTFQRDLGMSDPAWRLVAARSA